MLLVIVLLNFIMKYAKNYSMWQNIKSGTAFICILVYMCAVAFTGVGIYNAVNEQRFESRQEFAELTDFVMRARASGFFTKDYIDGIRARLDVSPAIDALIIDSPFGKAAFEKKSGLISYIGDSPDFNMKSPLYSEPQTASLRTDGGMTANISALSPFIDFNMLLYTARLSFLAILVAVTIAFATLIVDISIVEFADTASKSLKLLNVDSKSTVGSSGDGTSTVQPSGEGADVDEVLDTSSSETADGPFWDETLTDSSGDETFAVPSSGETADVPFRDESLTDPSEYEVSAVPFSVKVYSVPFQNGLLTESSVDETFADEAADVPSEGVQSDEYEELEELEGADDADVGQTGEYEELEQLDDKKTSTEKNTVGTGLLAAASALSQNDHLGDTAKDVNSVKEDTGFSAILEQELTEAEKSGNDLALLSIEGTDINFTPEALIKQSTGFFKTGSRFFEKDDGTGIYIVVPDVGLDEIFATAKDFYRHAASESTSHSEDPELLIGISARSTRNVNSTDLLNEAESALNKARFDRRLPIVGFRVNPQKYKDFIDKQ
jgi:hypothetical protein